MVALPLYICCNAGSNLRALKMNIEYVGKRVARSISLFKNDTSATMHIDNKIKLSKFDISRLKFIKI